MGPRQAPCTCTLSVTSGVQLTVFDSILAIATYMGHVQCTLRSCYKKYSTGFDHLMDMQYIYCFRALRIWLVILRAIWLTAACLARLSLRAARFFRLRAKLGPVPAEAPERNPSQKSHLQVSLS